MIDGKMMTDGGSGMYVYTCLSVSHLGDYSGNQRNTQQEQFVGNPVIRQSPYHGITADNLAIRICCGISIISCFHIGGKNISQSRQSLDKFCGNLLGAYPPLARHLVVVSVCCLLIEGFIL